jgi:hypothetical protein
MTARNFRPWKIVTIIVAAILAMGFPLLNSRITAWVQGPGFLDLLNRETSKGLKLQAQYSPLTRVGLLGMHADSFRGTTGEKTIVSIQAEDISGTFDPLGVIFRRWQIDDIHLKSGTVMLQKTEASGAKSRGMPWWGWFWPYRVHLEDVKVDDAKILWHLNEKESGIYDTKLEITPNGHDFEYDAQGGEFKTPLTPHLTVHHAHLLIRKPRLWVTDFVLGDDDAHPDQQLRLTGEAGLQDDRSMKVHVDLASLALAPWMPEKLRAHVSGHANGHFDYQSTGTGLETGQGKGHLAIEGGVLSALAAVREYVKVTGSPDPGELKLKTCEMDLRWESGAIIAENLRVECDGVFQLRGTLTIAKDQTLTGEVEFGITDPYIKWLPTAKQAIFTRQEGAYAFTTIHFSGTGKKPQQDLSPRVTKEVEKSPLLALKLFFNAAGNWFDFD